MTAPAARTGAPVRAARVGGPAVPLAALAVLAALASLVVVTRAGAWGLPAVHELPVDVTLGVAYPLTGALVLSGSAPARRLGWLLLGVGAAAAVTALATAVAATADRAGAVPSAAVWLQGWLWVGAFFPLLVLLPLLYPDGSLPSPRWRPVAVAAAAGTLLLAVAMATHPGTFEGRTTLDKPLTAEPVAQVAAVAAAVLLVPAALAGVASLVLRLRRSDGLARRQVVVFLVAAGVVLAEAFVHNALPTAVSSVTQPVAVVLLPVAVAVAATRHRLYDLDVAVLRALVGLSLAGCLAGAYLTAFAVARAALPGSTAVASALAAGLTGLAVQPLGTRLARSADRLYYGDRAEPWVALRGLADRLRAQTSVDEVPQAVCEAVVDTLRLPSAELVLDGRAVARAGTPAGPVEDVPLEHRGREVAVLRAGLRAGERVLDERDRALLQALADQAAPAVASRRVYDELRASREALVASREEERRRMRRDLHDGVGAALAGARLQLEGARDRVDDPLTVGMLDAASSAVSEAVDDVRRLTEDLRPPALDELGLAGSLTALASRVRTPALDVRTDADVPAGLPAAVEVAVHRIAAEALTNAARHSGARTVDVRLRPDGPALLLEVADDGAGIRTARRGEGLASMRQRAEELGGRLDVVTSERGTTVRAVLPTDLA